MAFFTGQTETPRWSEMVFSNQSNDMRFRQTIFNEPFSNFTSRNDGFGVVFKHSIESNRTFVNSVADSLVIVVFRSYKFTTNGTSTNRSGGMWNFFGNRAGMNSSTARLITFITLTVDSSLDLMMSVGCNAWGFRMRIDITELMSFLGRKNGIIRPAIFECAVLWMATSLPVVELCWATVVDFSMITSGATAGVTSGRFFWMQPEDESCLRLRILCVMLPWGFGMVVSLRNNFGGLTIAVEFSVDCFTSLDVKALCCWWIVAFCCDFTDAGASDPMNDWDCSCNGVDELLFKPAEVIYNEFKLELPFRWGRKVV